MTGLPPQRSEKRPFLVRPLSLRNGPHTLLGRFGLPIGLLILSLVVYAPAVGGAFLIDDDLLLTDNFVLQENGLYRVWFTTESLNYWPVTFTSFWLEHKLWGLQPAGYHVVNILIHAFSTILIWRILSRLNVRGAWVAAAIFCVHPVNAESVAWIAQRKNVLAMFFYLVALWSFFRFDESGRRSLYLASVVSFLAAMLSKGAVVATPLVLLLCLWWLHKPIGRRELLHAFPFFIIAAVMSLAELWFMHNNMNAGRTVRDVTFLQRLIGSGWVVWFYVYKAVLPINLSFFYPQWEIDASNWLSYLPGLALVGLLLICWGFRHTWGRPGLFALVYFVVTLGPVLGLADVAFFEFSVVADRYQYVSLIAVVSLVVSAGVAVGEHFSGGARQCLRAAAVGLILILGMLTFYRCTLFREPERLWRDTLAKNPACWVCHNELGIGLRNPVLAAYHFEKAIEIESDEPTGHLNLGSQLILLGDDDRAVEHFRIALDIDPKMWLAHHHWGEVLYRRGQHEEAARHFESAVLIVPKLGMTHWFLGMSLAKLGRFEKAIDHLDRAAEIIPENAAVQFDLGKLLFKLGNRRCAIRAFQRAVAIEPGNQLLREHLTRALGTAGRGSFEDASHEH